MIESKVAANINAAPCRAFIPAGFLARSPVGSFPLVRFPFFEMSLGLSLAAASARLRFCVFECVLLLGKLTPNWEQRIRRRGRRARTTPEEKITRRKRTDDKGATGEGELAGRKHDDSDGDDDDDDILDDDVSQVQEAEDEGEARRRKIEEKCGRSRKER